MSVNSPSFCGWRRPRRLPVTVVLLERDDAVRDAVSLSLELAGLDVLSFASRHDLDIIDLAASPDLLITDAEVYEPALENQIRRPSVNAVPLPVILTTSRLRQRVPPGGENHPLLHKPFGADQLFICVANALDGPGIITTPWRT